MIAYRTAVLTSLWLAALAVPTAAQQPTPEQQSAIRQNCRSDFMANCSGVQPGGREALQCLQSNAAKLSAACQGAIAAISPPAAPAPAQAAPAPTVAPPAPAAAAPPAAPAAAAPAAPTPAQRSAIQQSCRSDFMANCSGVQPGGAAALQCLQRNAAKLSPACQGAVAAVSPGGASAAAPAAPAARAAPATAAAPPAAAAPTPAQRSAIQQACRSDFMRNCRGVQPGGAEALQCLQRNSAQLSPACQGAVAAIAGGGAASAAAAVAAPPPAAAVAPMPMLPPRVELMVVRSCRPDLQMFCGGVQPGGGRLINCLAQNQPQVSPSCQMALARARQF
jgi:hypothetical protein